MDPSPLANGLASNPLAYMCAIALGVIAYLYKSRDDDRREAAKVLADLQTKYVETIRADAKEQREILAQVVPLTAKLTEGLELLEKLTDSLTKG